MIYTSRILQKSRLVKLTQNLMFMGKVMNVHYVVILADLDKQTWYAPVVKAFTPKGAMRAAQERYDDCIPIAALDENEIQHMLTAVRSKPDIISTQTPKDALIEKWVEIGQQNIWCSNAPDQFFGAHSFEECCSVRDLYEKLTRKNWHLGDVPNLL